MGKELLDTIIFIRGKLRSAKHVNGEISGELAVDEACKDALIRLFEGNIVDNVIVVQGRSITLEKLSFSDGQVHETTISLFTKRLSGAEYFETTDGFVRAHQYDLPTLAYYIQELDYPSTSGKTPAKILAHHDIVQLIALLSSVADYEQEVESQHKELIFFEKKKVSLSTVYNANLLKSLSFLPALEEQLTEAHDKVERIAIFKTELIATLLPIAEEDRFGELLLKIDTVYDTYLKSHLLYLDKFSYHDLKAEVDEDRLDYAKKIYNTVNDVQTKLIAAPAAFVLLLSQFDFSGASVIKNVLLATGAVLFAILLEILLTNQFGVLKYIESEIRQVQQKLTNKDTSLDLSEFITSFGNLDKLSIRQRMFLWIFRGIVWIIPISTVIMVLATTK